MPKESTRLGRALRMLLPIGAALLIALLTVCLWRYLLGEEQQIERLRVNRAAIEAQHESAQLLDSTLIVFERMVHRWGLLRDMTVQDRRSDARLLVEGIYSIIGIVRTDPAGTVLWRVPGAGVEFKVSAETLFPVANTDEHPDDLTRNRARISVSPDGPSTGAILLASIPVSGPGGFTGHLICAIDSARLLSDTLEAFRSAGFGGIVTVNGQPVFRFGEDRRSGGSLGAAAIVHAIGIAGAAWGIELWPTATMDPIEVLKVSHFALLAGLLMALLVGLAVRFHLSAREQTRVALQASDELNRFFTLSASPMGILSLDGRIRRVNSAFADGLGYSQGELLDRNVIDLLTPDDREQAVAALAGLAQGTHIEDFLAALRTKGGLLRWQSWRAVPDLSREVIYAAARDVTEQRNAERALQESHEQLEGRVQERTQKLAETVADLERTIAQRDRYQEEMVATEGRFRDLIEGSLQGIIVHDSFKPLFCNAAYARMHGFAEPEDVLALDTIEDLLAPHEQARIESYVRERTRGGSAPSEYEYEGRTRDGGILWILSHARRIQWENRPAIQATLIDRTAAKRTEEQLERQTAVLAESEKRNRRLVNALPYALVIVGEDGRLLDMNPQTTSIFGYERDELIGRPVEALLPESRRAKHVGLRKAYLDAPEVRPMGIGLDVVGMRKDGSEFPAEISLSPDRTMRGAEVICTIVDITERRQLQAQMAASQKLETIGQLAGGVAHDFNNMLAVILSYGNFVLEALPEHDPNRDDVQQILTAANRSAALTRQLLAFSRRQMLKLEDTDLNSIVAGMEKMLRRLIGEDIQLSIHPASDLDIVRADASQMEQVILNLAVNARDAMPMGGQLTIETCNATLDEGYVNSHIDVAPGSYVMLSVSDTGTGMEESTKERIFEPFFTTKEQGKGTGLGLSTVFGIVKQLGGSIFVYSELGHGTTFKIYLPRVAASSAAAAQQELPTPETRASGTILLVEDEAQVRTAARRILESAGYRVIEAADGNEAISLAKEETRPIDLLVTDVVMPKMSGAELAVQVLALCPGVQVLYMTGYTEGAISQHGVLKEGVHVVFKPFSKASLLDEVRKLRTG